MPQTALPYLYIWEQKFTEEDFINLKAQANSDAERTYVDCLKQFKRCLTKNYSYYNSPKECNELIGTLDTLLTSVANSDVELTVAVLNLKGLCLQLITKRYEDAIACYQQALTHKETIKPESVASVLTNLSTTLTNQAKHLEAYELAHEIQPYLARIILSTDQEQLARQKQIIASVLNRTAVCYAKLGDINTSNMFHQAQENWPGNEIIINNTAINLIKLDTGDTQLLLQAEKIFLTKYAEAKLKNSFVNLYYRADIIIKLVAYAFKNGDIFNAEADGNLALDLLREAEHALTNNPAYDVNYRSKGFARLAYLQSNLAALRGQFVDAQEWQEIAMAFRQNVAEPPAKQEKFQAKFIKLTTAAQELVSSGYVNPSRLFRPRSLSTQSIDSTVIQSVRLTC